MQRELWLPPDQKVWILKSKSEILCYRPPGHSAGIMAFTSASDAIAAARHIPLAQAVEPVYLADLAILANKLGKRLFLKPEAEDIINVDAIQLVKAYEGG